MEILKQNLRIRKKKQRNLHHFQNRFEKTIELKAPELKEK